MSTVEDEKTSQEGSQSQDKFVIENIDAVNMISDDPEDPMNWSEGKKWAILLSVSYASFVSNYMAGAHNTAFTQLAAYFKVSIGDAANTVGYAILGLAVGPLLWTALARSVGRRHTYIISSFLFFCCTVWLAFSRTFSSFVAARVMAGFFGSASLSVASYTIADIYPKEVRGTKVAIWTTGIVTGPLIAPFFCGFIVYTQKWQVVYYVIMAQAFVSLLLFIFLVPETLYTRRAVKSATSTVPALSASIEAQEQAYVVEGTRGPAYMPWKRPGEFALQLIKPLLMSRFIVILVPSIWYATCFGWSVGTTIALPQVFETPVAAGGYGFTTRIVGCTFLANFGGAIVGKWSGGIIGDKVMAYVTKRNGGVREPEYRLWAMVIILPFLTLGLLMFGCGIGQHLHFMVPVMGVFFYNIGIIGITSVCGTYVIDTYVSEAAAGTAVINFYKFIFSFAVPFFIVEWAKGTSYVKAYVVQSMLSGPLGFVIFGFFIWKGKAIREWQNMPSHAVKA